MFKPFFCLVDSILLARTPPDVHFGIELIVPVKVRAENNNPEIPPYRFDNSQRWLGELHIFLLRLHLHDLPPFYSVNKPILPIKIDPSPTTCLYAGSRIKVDDILGKAGNSGVERGWTTSGRHKKKTRTVLVRVFFEDYLVAGDGFEPPTFGL